MVREKVLLTSVAVVRDRSLTALWEANVVLLSSSIVSCAVIAGEQGSGRTD